VVGLRELLALAWPVVLSRSTQSVVGLADALMSARLGDEALASVTTGAVNLFSVACLPMGVVFIVQSFAAQLQGRGDLIAARRYAYYGLVVAVITMLVAVIATPFISPLIGLFGFAPGVHDSMTVYVQWRAWSMGPFVAMEALGNWFGGLGDTRPHMRASVIVMVANIVLNWVLIFGNLGAPAMGVSGAALASGLATCLGLAYLLAGFAVRQRELSQGQPIAPRMSEFLRMLRFGVPNGLNWFMEIAAFTLFLNAVVSKLGTTVLAAMSAILHVNSISFMPSFGLASAGAVFVGQAIGRGDKDQVPRIVALTVKVAMVWQVGVGLLYFLFPGPLMSAFDSGPQSHDLVRIGAGMLAMSAAWQVFDALGITIGEALRGAGDTAWCMWARLTIAWLLFVPVSWWWVGVKGGGPLAAIGAVVFYLAVLGLAFVWRFTSGAWRRIELVEAEPAP
jgi:MATE family multidrug resistance protein